MAYKRTYKRKMRSARRGYKKARRSYKKAYRKSLGFGKKASNTMPKVRGRLGIFDNEMYANLSVVDMLQERLLVFAPFMSGDQLRNNWDHTVLPGRAAGVLVGNPYIEAKKICPFLVVRLNCSRDPYHSVACPWDAPFNVNSGQWTGGPGTQLFIADDASLDTYLDRFKGLINGQPTFSLIEGGEDPSDVNNRGGYFFPTNGTAGNMLLPTSNIAGESTGPFIPYRGICPQGYVKAAQAYSRAIVYESTFSVTIMNSSPISKRPFDKSKTMPGGRHGIHGSTLFAFPDTVGPTWSYTPDANGAYSTGAVYKEPGIPAQVKPIATTPGDFEAGTLHSAPGQWEYGDKEGYYSPIGICFYGPVGYNPGNTVQDAKLNLVLTEDCSSSDPRFVWFGVTARKNYTSDKQNSTVLPLTGALPEYPAGIPSALEDHQLGQESTYMLVNITDGAPAATITKTYVIKDWLGTGLTDSQHGFYTAFPSVTIAQNNANRRAFFPAQGLYAIVWLAPAIRTGTLFAQTVYGTSPYSDEPFSTVGRPQGVNPKMGKQVNTGYSDFFCCHSRIDMKTKFYEPRSLKSLQANAAAGDIGSILLPYDNPNYV